VKTKKVQQFFIRYLDCRKKLAFDPQGINKPSTFLEFSDHLWLPVVKQRYMDTHPTY
jgi:hypothetical protein